AGLWNLPFNELEIATGLRNLYCFHAWHSRSPLAPGCFAATLPLARGTMACMRWTTGARRPDAMPGARVADRGPHRRVDPGDDVRRARPGPLDGGASAL